MVEQNGLHAAVNQTFLQESIAYFKGQESAWAKTHGFGYPGEAMERFAERNALRTLPDLRAFLLAACYTAHLPYEHYGDQRANLLDVYKQTAEYEQDGLLQVLGMVWDTLLHPDKPVDASFMPKLTESAECIAALAVLQAFSYPQHHPHICYSVLQKLSLGDLFAKPLPEKLDDLKVLIDLYETLRPKKSDCKAFLPVYDAMLYGWRLSKKELKLNVFVAGWEKEVADYTNALLCTAEDVIRLQHLLFEWERPWAKLSIAARERVFEESLKVELTSIHPPSDFFKQHASMLAAKQEWSKNAIKNIGHWFSKVQHEDAIQLVHSLSEHFQCFEPTLSLLSRLDLPVFTKKNAEHLVEGAISKGVKEGKFSHMTTLNESRLVTSFTDQAVLQTWQLIEKKRKEWNLGHYSRAVVSLEYLRLLFDLGIYAMEDYFAIKEAGLERVYQPFVKRMGGTDPDRFVELLALIPLEDRAFLGEEQHYGYSYRSKEKTYFQQSIYQSVEEKSTYAALVFETMYYHDPMQYGEEVYRLSQEGILEDMGLSSEQIQDLLSFAYYHNLFENESIIRNLKESFMTDEEKKERDRQAILAKIRSCANTFDLRYVYSSALGVIACEEVQEHMLQALQQTKVKYESDIQDLFEWIQKLKKANQTPPAFVEEVTGHLNRLIASHVKVNRKELAYNRYAYRVIKQAEKEMNQKKENDEPCQTQTV